MNETTQNSTSYSDEDEVSLLEILTIIGEAKRFIFLFTLTCAVIAAVVSLIIRPTFTAKTVFMPPQQQSSSASSLLSSLGGLAGLPGGAVGVKSPDEMYIAFIKSEGVLNRLISQYKLQERYESDTVLDTRKKLLDKLRVLPDKKSGLISVEVDDHDPAFSATLANAFVSELGNLTDRLAVTDAQQRAKFFEAQINKTQVRLSEAEALFRAAQAKSGFQVPSINADTGLKSIAELHGQIAAREIQLQAIDRFATSKNNEVQKLTSELAAMRMALQKLEQGSGQSSLGAIQQEAMSAYRDMKIQESMLEAFVKQLEIARVDESKEGPLIQVVDVATPPERRSSPKRTIMVLISLVAGFFLSLLIVFVRHLLSTVGNDPEEIQRLSRLKSAWKL